MTVTEDDPIEREMQRPITLNQAAELVQVSPSTVRRWASTGLLETIRWRRRLYARTIDVLDTDAEQRRKAARRKGGDRRNTPTPRPVVDIEAMHISSS